MGNVKTPWVLPLILLDTSIPFPHSSFSSICQAVPRRGLESACWACFHMLVGTAIRGVSHCYFESSECGHAWGECYHHCCTSGLSHSPHEDDYRSAFETTTESLVISCHPAESHFSPCWPVLLRDVSVPLSGDAAMNKAREGLIGPNVASRDPITHPCRFNSSHRLPTAAWLALAGGAGRLI